LREVRLPGNVLAGFHLAISLHIRFCGLSMPQPGGRGAGASGVGARANGGFRKESITSCAKACSWLGRFL